MGGSISKTQGAERFQESRGEQRDHVVGKQKGSKGGGEKEKRRLSSSTLKLQNRGEETTLK